MKEFFERIGLTGLGYLAFITIMPAFPLWLLCDKLEGIEARMAANISAVCLTSKSVSTSRDWPLSVITPAFDQPQEPSGCSQAQMPLPTSCKPLV